MISILMDDIFNLCNLCKQIKILHKQGYEPNTQTLPFEMAKSRFVDGEYEIIHISGDTIIHTKENLHNAIVDMDKHLVYCMERKSGDGYEMIGILHLTKYIDN